MNRMIQMAIVVAWAAVLTGCGSAYSGLTNQSGLGAAQYRPAVVVEPGNEAKYEQVLSDLPLRGCRIVKRPPPRRRSSSPLPESWQAPVPARQADWNSDRCWVPRGSIPMRSRVRRLVRPQGPSPESPPRSRAERKTTADETRRILLNCLRQTSRNGTLWQVVE